MTTTTAAPGLTTPQTHLDAFEAAMMTLPGHERQRRAALARFAELGFPNDRNEDWKFTSVKPIVRTPFLLPGRDSAKAVEAFRKNLLHEEPGVTLACINGNDPFLLTNSKPLPRSVVGCSLVEASERYPGTVEAHLGRHAPGKDHAFVALNLAFWDDGAFAIFL